MGEEVMEQDLMTPLQGDPRLLEDYLRECGHFCYWLHQLGCHDLVKLHKAVLGPQNRTFQGKYRYWIWQGDTWTAYVSNKKGIVLNVSSDCDASDAWNAWRSYLETMTKHIREHWELGKE